MGSAVTQQQVTLSHSLAREVARFCRPCMQREGLTMQRMKHAPLLHARGLTPARCSGSPTSGHDPAADVLYVQP